MTSATTQLNGTRLIFFSPTHTSARIARAIGEGIGMGRRMETDLTLDEQTSPIEMNGELCVIAVPVYGGRVAATALQRLQRLKGNGSPAILVVVYGNRDYEDALLELRDTAVQLGLYLSLQVRSSGNIVLVHRNFLLLPDVRIQMIYNRPVSLEKVVWKNGKNCKLPEPLSLN